MKYEEPLSELASIGVNVLWKKVRRVAANLKGDSHSWLWMLIVPVRGGHDRLLDMGHRRFHGAVTRGCGGVAMCRHHKNTKCRLLEKERKETSNAMRVSLKCARWVLKRTTTEKS